MKHVSLDGSTAHRFTAAHAANFQSDLAHFGGIRETQLTTKSPKSLIENQNNVLGTGLPNSLLPPRNNGLDQGVGGLSAQPFNFRASLNVFEGGKLSLIKDSNLSDLLTRPVNEKPIQLADHGSGQIQSDANKNGQSRRRKPIEVPLGARIDISADSDHRPIKIHVFDRRGVHSEFEYKDGMSINVPSGGWIVREDGQGRRRKPIEVPRGASVDISADPDHRPIYMHVFDRRGVHSEFEYKDGMSINVPWGGWIVPEY